MGTGISFQDSPCQVRGCSSNVDIRACVSVRASRSRSWPFRRLWAKACPKPGSEGHLRGAACKVARLPHSRHVPRGGTSTLQFLRLPVYFWSVPRSCGATPRRLWGQFWMRAAGKPEGPFLNLGFWRRRSGARLGFAVTAISTDRGAARSCQWTVG